MPARVLRDVKFTYLLVEPRHGLGVDLLSEGHLWGIGTVAKSTLVLSSVHTPHSEDTLYDLCRSLHV